MKLPMSWLREFVTVDTTVDEIAHRLSVAGLVVENVETILPRFQGVFVAKVVEAGRHPNADRLSLCRVDVGAQGQFNVVCGAPNVRSGMTAALAVVGARLAGSDKGEHGDGVPRFEDVPPLEAAVIRGVRSEGMLCSERELGLSTEHAGILDLPDKAEIGIDLANFLQLPETVLDVEITPNRGDCLSIVGLAREVAALFGVKLKTPRRRVSRRRRPVELQMPVTVQIDAPDLCPRYAALAMTSVAIARSPLWLRRRLELCGMRALNSVVDATNYVMLELGQPLHAFDLSKIAEGKIVVRRAGPDQTFTTLDDVNRRLEPDDLMIADTAKPLAIAGVMGGLNSEVGDSTKAILLESAYFEPATIAKTSRRLQLGSEASYRFARGIDRAGQPAALRRAAELILEGGGGAVGEIIDVDARPAAPREIILDLRAMESLLGAPVEPAETRRRLTAIGAEVSSGGRGIMKVVPPSWRPDVNEAADLAEEVARLSGLDDIPAVLPPRAIDRAIENPERSFYLAAREVMLGAGFTEAITLTFTSPSDNAPVAGLGAGAQPVKVENPLSAELGELRMSLIPGLLGALRFNLNREATAFHAFEIGKVFSMSDGVPIEIKHLAAVTSGLYLVPGIGHEGGVAGFYSLKGAISSFFAAMDLESRISFRALETGVQLLHPRRAAEIVFDGSSTGYIGELHPSKAMALELISPCAVCELDLTKLISYGFAPRKTIEAPPRFPIIRRDVALIVDQNLPAEMVTTTIKEVASPLLETVEVFDVYEGQAVAPGRKSVALACRYRSKERTLTDEEVNRIHAATVEQARVRLGAELRN